MINTSTLDLDNLIQIYAVANTPAYLFRHLRSEWNVQDFARQNSTNDLVDYVFEVDGMKERSIHDVVKAYIAIVALTFKEYSEVQDAMNGKSFTSLEWAEEILSIWKSTYIPTINLSITNFPPIIVTSKRQASASTNIVNIHA